MRKRLVVEAERCTGCTSCALTCSMVHEQLFSFMKARIRISREAEKAASYPRVCVQCEEAPCISSCPVKALSRVEMGAIWLDRDACTGCEACVSVCPYGGIFFDSELCIPLICDLCGGDPECVRFCLLPKAIRYE